MPSSAPLVPASAERGPPRASARELFTAFEQAVIGMTLMGPDQRVLRVNRAFCEFLGHDRDYLLKSTMYDVVHPDDIEEQRRQRARLLAGEAERYRMEKRYLHAGGHVVWADFSSTLVRDEQGRPLHFISQVVDVTQRKHAELALQQSEARFRSLCALSSEWYWEQDAQFRFTRFEDNARTPPWMHDRLQSLIGRRRWEIPGTQPVQGDWLQHQATLEAHLPYFAFETYDRVNDRYISTSGEPVYTADRRFAGYRGIGRDMTAQRKLEARLHEAQTLMDIAGQVGRVGGWVLERDAAALTLSPQVRSILGTQGDPDPQPEQALDWVAPRDRPRLRALLAKALSDGSPFATEAQVVPGAGRTLWVRIIGEAERDEHGAVRRLRGALQDITEGKDAQQALQESQRTLAALMTNLPGLAYRCLNEPDWPMRFISGGALALTGYTPQELMAGQPHYGDLMYPEDRAPVWTAVQQAVTQRRQFELRYRLRTRSGEEKWVWEQGCGVYGDDGQLRWLEGFVTDVTQSHLAQLEVARLNEHLEERVAQRTRELQVANEELEAVAYSIAHDLRAPMTALHGFSQLLQNNLRDLDPRNAHYFGRVVSNVRYMSDLTDALLSLARLSAVEVASRPLDLAEIAREALRRMSDLEPQREVVAEIPPSLLAMGDPALLQRVMANLIGNAWKFSRPKPVTFIRVGCETGPDGAAVYFVQDRGVGFDMAHASNLFGAFRRLHGQTEFEGTGIGLALVRKIVGRHGGRVWARAEPGTGATIYFTLRASDSQTSDSSDPANTSLK